MQRPQPTFCPLIQGTCKQFDCLFWTQLRGTHPQTGAEIDEYDCAVRWLPILLIENAKEVRQGAAAVESFRNHVVREQQRLDHGIAVLSGTDALRCVGNGEGS